MRILLFSLSAILSGIMVFLSYQNLHNEKNISELTTLKESLEKKVRLMEKDLRVANAKALDHTLHIKSTHLSGDPDED